ncbi:MAG: copper amine oxidase N-terminal domain-containing protein [Clostridia bacterium]|nr:copper amine oxidase N-terminal domain-containing protein [Clostridia bacterium]
MVGLVLAVTAPLAIATDSATYRGFPVAQVKVNGQTVTSDVPAIVVDGRTMVPLRFVVQALGGQVDWDQATRTASIHAASTFTADVLSGTLKSAQQPVSTYGVLALNWRVAFPYAQKCIQKQVDPAQAVQTLEAVRVALDQLPADDPLRSAAAAEARAVGELESACGIMALLEPSSPFKPTAAQAQQMGQDAMALARAAVYEFQKADQLSAQAGAGHFMSAQDQQFVPW